MRNEGHTKFLHPDDIELWERVEGVIWSIADKMVLPLKDAEPNGITFERCRAEEKAASRWM